MIKSNFRSFYMLLSNGGGFSAMNVLMTSTGQPIMTSTGEFILVSAA